MSINNKGNTLVIVILAIVGVLVVGFIAISIFLAGAGTSKFVDTQIQARNNKREADVNVISKSLESSYGYDSNGQVKPNQYPAVAGSWFTSGKIPTDPSTGAIYSGVPTTSVTNFHICATLEGNNPQYCVDSQHK